MKKKILFIIIAIIAICGLITLAFPIPVDCGAPGSLCMTAPDSNGQISTYYEVEPFGLFLSELITRIDIPIYYTSGHNTTQLKGWSDDCIQEGKFTYVVYPPQRCCKGLKEVPLSSDTDQMDGVRGKCIK